MVLLFRIRFLHHLFFGKVLKFRGNLNLTIFTENMDFVLFITTYPLDIIFSEQIEEGQSKRFTEKNVDAKI